MKSTTRDDRPPKGRQIGSWTIDLLMALVGLAGFVLLVQCGPGV